MKITFIDNITVRFAAIFPKFWSGFFLKLLFGVTKQDVTCVVGWLGWW